MNARIQLSLYVATTALFLTSQVFIDKAPLTACLGIILSLVLLVGTKVLSKS